MKHNHFLLILLLTTIALLGLSGCTSTNTLASAEEQGLYYKNPQTEEKLLIEEWKYMGFGQPLPEWVIPALEENINKVREVIPELANEEVLVMQNKGYTLDQAEAGLSSEPAGAGYNLYDSFWVRGDYSSKENKKIEKMYISVAVYHKKISAF